MGLWRGSVWFNGRTDAISINPKYCGLITLYGSRKIRCNEVAPALRTLMSSTKTLLNFSSRLIEDECFPPLGEENKACVPGDVPRWILQRIGLQNKCTVILDNLTIRMTYESACASGLFGHFAEETPIHIDVQNNKQVERLLATCNNELTRSGRRKSLQKVQDRFRTGYQTRYFQDISFFLLCLKTIWLKRAKLLPPNLDPHELTEDDERLPHFKSALDRLPELTFVVAIHFCELGIERKSKQ